MQYKILIIFLISALPIASMDESITQIKQDLNKSLVVSKSCSMACLANGKFAVAEEKICTIFNSHNKLIHRIESPEKIFDMATNEKKTLLALAINFNPPIIYNSQTNTHSFLEGNILDHSTKIVFSAEYNAFFTSNGSKLIAYDEDKQIKKIEHPFPYLQYISAHPTKKEFLCCNSNYEVFIIQPDENPFIKIKFKIDLMVKQAEYSPDGQTIAFLHRDLKRDESCYFICDFSNRYKSLEAHRLGDKKQYFIASKFHPKYPLIALLSDQNYIYLFDYKTKKCNHMKKLIDIDEKEIESTTRHTYLDFDDTGTELFVVLDNILKKIPLVSFCKPEDLTTIASLQQPTSNKTARALKNQQTQEATIIIIH